MCKSTFLYNSFKHAKIICVYIYILPSPNLCLQCKTTTVEDFCKNDTLSLDLELRFLDL